VDLRHRYDSRRRKRYTTIELIVAKAEWEPLPALDTIVGVRVAWGKADLAHAIKAAGGQWDRRQRV
jgi:hypothetical protein